ncbi:HAD-IA family hydrolase [Streptomyces sp. CA-111067]|uniref:HAD-IA family hydrolase n=1 Tax=Streptomyces sp. CA-111067 TaxID=3240046 RepID=UPI003D9908DB
MTLTACMFDFSGTLFRIESSQAWLRAVLDARGIEAAEDEVAACALRLDRAGAQPGGRSGEAPVGPTPDLAPIWAIRDLTAEHHRAAHTAMSRTAELPWDVHDALYDRHMTPAAWQPYQDTAGVLRALRERGVPVAVVSNIGWDLRPVFRQHGLDGLVDSYVLSYEVGAQKPDPRIFEIACEALGSDPASTLMVGDDRRSDSGAAALGCPLFLVDHLPVAERPEALRPVLDSLDERRFGEQEAARPSGPA